MQPKGDLHPVSLGCTMFDYSIGPSMGTTFTAFSRGALTDPDSLSNSGDSLVENVVPQDNRPGRVLSGITGVPSRI